MTDTLITPTSPLVASTVPSALVICTLKYSVVSIRLSEFTVIVNDPTFPLMVKSPPCALRSLEDVVVFTIFHFRAVPFATFVLVTTKVAVSPSL